MFLDIFLPEISEKTLKRKENKNLSKQTKNQERENWKKSKREQNEKISSPFASN